MKIGLRIPGTARQMPFQDFCTWCKENGFDGVDLGGPDPNAVQTVRQAGLEVGTVDIHSLGGFFGSDADAEKALADSKAFIDVATSLGCFKYFVVLMPPDGSKGRAANFERLKETFAPLLQYAEEKGVRIGMEGYPGGPPHYAALGVTPEMLRAIFKAFPSPALGINYDPSHLIRIGVDYIRFLEEFGERVIHCHGKDTVFDQEAMYLHGSLGKTFGRTKGFGEDWWRYCIPGEGLADWAKIGAILDAKGFDGMVSVELEDFRYWKTWEKESLGLLRAKEHLRKYL
jgi:sugar phosphate isomerase/epimerase